MRTFAKVVPTSVRAGLFLLAAAFLASAAEGKPRDLVIIHSYEPNEWTGDLTRGVLASVHRDPSMVPTYHFHSDYWSKRPVDEQAKERERVLKFVADHDPKAVLICDDEASDFLIPSLSEKGRKIFVTGVNRSTSSLPWLSAVKAGAVMGILEHFPFEKSVQILKREVPGIQSFSILGSDSVSTDRRLEVLFTPKGRAVLTKNKLALRKIYESSFWEDWKAAIKEVNAAGEILWIHVPYGLFDSNHQEITQARMVQWLKRNLMVPTIGPMALSEVLPIVVGLSPKKMGLEIGTLIRAYLYGKSFASIGLKDTGAYEFLIRRENLKLAERNRTQNVTTR